MIKKYTAAFAVGMFLGMSSCAHLKPVIDAGTYCADQAVSDAASQVVPELEDILACSIDVKDVPACAVAGIEKFSKQFGEDVLMCALAEIAGRKNTGAVDSPAAVMSRRAAKVLADRAAK